jgi:beta-lactam-binding protein with PASTA domain
MDGGGTDVKLDDFIGMPYDEAIFNIRGYNLNVGEVYVIGDTTGGDAVVLKQAPEGNQDVKVGDLIDLWIGKPGTTVPDEDGDDDPE